jgi:hypothetical protein
MSNKQNPDLVPLLVERFKPCVDKSGKVYIRDRSNGNLRVYSEGSRAFAGHVQRYVRSQGIKASRDMLKDLMDEMITEAQHRNDIIEPQLRVAKIGGVVTLDMGDQTCSDIVLKDGAYSVVKSGNDVPFISSPTTAAICLPDDIPIIDHFALVADLPRAEMLLLIFWVTFIMTHPKCSRTSYPILVAFGLQGSGKSVFSVNIQQLLDPRTVGVQKIPSNTETLSIMATNAHLIILDNVRSIKQDMADNFCLTSTGGTRLTRKLYSNNEESINNLQVAVVLNGIHCFIGQNDLAERCICINLPTIPSAKRKTEREISKQFDEVLPRLMAGLYDLAAKTLVKLPAATVLYPERMMDFCEWIAASELAIGECLTQTYSDVEIGSIQAAYSANLKKASRENLNENELAAAVLDFAHKQVEWDGTPTDLFDELEHNYSDSYSKSRYWPRTAISMSKQLRPLVTALASQDVVIRFTRGKNREISILYKGQEFLSEELKVSSSDGTDKPNDT